MDSARSNVNPSVPPQGNRVKRAMISKSVGRIGLERFRSGFPKRRAARSDPLLQVWICFLLLATFWTPLRLSANEGVEKPKIRAITAFVRIDRAHYREQIAETLKLLRQTKTSFEKGGYEVESVRITTQPFPEIVRGLSRDAALKFFREYDALAVRESFDPNIGPAMISDSDDPAQAELLAEILAQTKTLEGSVIVAGDDGIHWKSVHAAAKLVKYVSEHTAHGQGTFNFAATAMLAPYAPFFPGSYHTGDGHRFAVGWEAANVVEEAFAGAPNNAPLAAEKLMQAFTKHALIVDRIAREMEKRSGWTYMGLDATPVPMGNVSIGRAIEKFTGARFGSSGTLTASSLITKAVQSLPVKRIGYSGLMLPIMEDSLLAERWGEGAYNTDSVLAYSAVCGTGLDTIPLPGDVTEEQISRMIGDVASLAVKWRKPLTARLQPAPGKKAGEKTDFDDPYLVNTTIQPLP
jgi:uncharacterized protein